MQPEKTALMSWQCLASNPTIHEELLLAAFCTVLYNNCTVFVLYLYCICTVFVLYCIVLYCIVLYCIVLYCIVINCSVLCCVVLYCVFIVYYAKFWKICNVGCGGNLITVCFFPPSQQCRRN